MEKIINQEIGFEVKGRTLLIRLSKDLDHHNSVFIRDTADELLEKYKIKTIVFDFSRVEFMDSSGIGVLLGRYKKVGFMGGCVKACAVKNNVNRIFQMAGLHKLIQRYDTVEEAMT